MIALELDLRQGHSHLVDVCLRFTPRQHRLVLALPRWTPGSYLLREYVGHLEGLVVHQGGVPLTARRTTPFVWQLELSELAPLTISYTIQAAELSVRTAHLTDEHGFLPLAAVVLAIEGERWTPHQLKLVLPDHWQGFVPLPQQTDGTWLASDLDQLIDSPVEAGPHAVHGFSVAGVPHRWVTWGDDLPGHDAHWLADVEAVCLTCCRLLAEPQPAASSYLFVLHLTEQGYGGLEHDASTVLQFGRRTLCRPEGRRKLLQLVAHEYLHQWNVRRLRPAELVPIDYGDAVVVPTLWFAEGVTSYLDQLLPHAAGCCSGEQVIADLGDDLSRYRLSQGRQVQSLLSSSEEAWVKLYRPHAHAASQQISYYLKGAVLALVLDLHLRRHGSWIGAVLQTLWRSHGRCRRGYSQADLLAVFAALAPDLATLLPHWLGSTEDPPLEPLLADVGLQLTPLTAKVPHLGCQFEARAGGGLWVSRCERNGPAQRSGLQVGDECIALDGERIRTLEELQLLLGGSIAGQRPADERPAGQRLPSRDLLISRDGRLCQLTLQPEAPAVERWTLTAVPQASPDAMARRQSWLALQPPCA